MTKLPLTQDHPDVTEPEDWWYDDGDVCILMTVRDDVAILHDVVAKNPSEVAARTGIGRKAMARLRDHFREIVASGVGDPYAGSNYDQQPAFLFWRQMLREGLIDRISFIICGTEMTREELVRPVETMFCTVNPANEDIIERAARPNLGFV